MVRCILIDHDGVRLLHRSFHRTPDPPDRQLSASVTLHRLRLHRSPAFFVVSGGAASTLPLNLFNVASQSVYVKNWNLIFAYVVLMSIPMVVTFIIAQRRIVAGVTAGAVK